MRPNIAAHASTAYQKAERGDENDMEKQIGARDTHGCSHALLSFALPRGGGSFLRDTQAAQFPVTVGVWAIFVSLFVKLK